MTARTATTIRSARLALFALVMLAPVAVIAGPPIVQPGAPGEPARDLSADEAVAIANSSYSPADVRFMQDMIPHHHQALEMAELAADRTNRQELIDVAGRTGHWWQHWPSSRSDWSPTPRSTPSASPPTATPRSPPTH